MKSLMGLLGPVPSYLNREVRVQALAENIVLCSWASHLLTVPLSTQALKWVTSNLMLGQPQWGRILLVASCYRNWDKIGLITASLFSNARDKWAQRRAGCGRGGERSAPPLSCSSLPFCPDLQFSRYSVCTFNNRIGIRNIESCEHSRIDSSMVAEK